jgi:mono/diheme cytochrome c family protein
MRVQQPSLDLDDMRGIVNYVWAMQFFREAGDARRGESAFRQKGCAGCHSSSGGAPVLAAGNKEFTAITIVAALSRHGPAMLDVMKKRNREWPRFTGEEMANLVTFLAQGK